MLFITVVILVSVCVGWLLGMISNWLILARTLPWLDVKMLPKQGVKPVVSGGYQPAKPGFHIPPTESVSALSATQEVTA